MKKSWKTWRSRFPEYEVDKALLSWSTRLRLCWNVLTKGTFNPSDYRSRHLQKQWETIQKRRIELEAASRPRTDTPWSDYMDQ